ncbi:outer membrane protein assembly factor BamB [Thiomicrospira sp.]|uniref:outer membrane protein assembly factor BamB n=1 Tax=Thiomicrospira sp. TaxID=935 RepID=UPI002F956647
MKNSFLVATLCLSAILLQACSTPSKTVRTPTPLAPGVVERDLSFEWQVSVDKLAQADGRSLTIADDSERLYVASSSGLVSALWKQSQSRYTDQVIWQTKYEAEILAGPVFIQDKLLIGSSKGDLLALSPETGQVIWQTQLNSEVISTPVVERGRVFVRTNDGRVVALNLQSGAVIWVADHQMPNLFIRGAAPVLVNDDKVYVGRESGFVEALSFSTGETLWDARIATPSGRTDLERMVDIQSSLVLDNQRLFVLSYNGRMAAVNPRNGNLSWAKDISGYRDFVVLDNVIYLVDDEDVLRALDPVTGTEFWNQTALQYRLLGDVIIDSTDATSGTSILLSDGLGYLHWVDPKDGHISARFKHANHLKDGEKILRIHQDKQHYYVLDSDGGVTAYHNQNAPTTRPGGVNSSVDNE